mmetsp:Transcript_9213/g.20437  ORF Transcript_9213/g.20437 Transcript_9213/m.20437 type:complete len:232 (+) Transcript_9213:649-1344(+)
MSTPNCSMRSLMFFSTYVRNSPRSTRPELSSSSFCQRLYRIFTCSFDPIASWKTCSRSRAQAACSLPMRPKIKMRSIWHASLRIGLSFCGAVCASSPSFCASTAGVPAAASCSECRAALLKAFTGTTRDFTVVLRSGTPFFDRAWALGLELASGRASFALPSPAGRASAVGRASAFSLFGTLCFRSRFGEKLGLFFATSPLISLRNGSCSDAKRASTASSGSTHISSSLCP